MPRLSDHVARVRCPYCLERVELFVDPETEGSFVEDCAVCCRPWTVLVERTSDGQGVVEVMRGD